VAFKTSITAAVSPTNYIVGGNSVQVIGALNVTDAALLGNLTLTFRWTEDDVDRTHVETLLLTALTNSKPFIFAAAPDADTMCTWEASLSGVTGTFACELCCNELGL
jgi:hypothetical protein